MSFEWKAIVDTVGIKSAYLKDKFSFQSFAAFLTAKLRNYRMLLKMTREIIVSSDWFGYVLVISSYVAKVFSEAVT